MRPTMADLDELVGRYLPGSTPESPTFVGDSLWHPILDGEPYARQIADHLATLEAGDAIAIAGLEVSPTLQLVRPDGPPLGELLVAAAARGVEVRVLVAGKALLGGVPPRALGPFRDNARDVHRLRSWPAPDGSTPLADRVGFDFTGPLLGSNHQKIVAMVRSGELTAWVGGVDLAENSLDEAPHDRKQLKRRRWGWHDMAVRLEGPVAVRVWDELRRRWQEVSALPPRRHGRRQLNPPTPAPTLPPVAPPAPRAQDGVAVRVQRSVSDRAVDSLAPWRRRPWTVTPVGGYQEVFETLVRAIGVAERYIYLEDQYLGEALGAPDGYELYPHLRAAVERGVRLIMVGSGVRDPEDLGPQLRAINRTVPRDVRTKIVERLPHHRRNDVVVYRVEHATVHAKLVMIDDVFAHIGSANMFARSMSGVDCEISAAVVTTTSLVRDLRVRLWAEHLRVPLTDGLDEALGDLDLALGVWRPEWLPEGAHPQSWRSHGTPEAFRPTESVLTLVGP